MLSSSKKERHEELPKHSKAFQETYQVRYQARARGDSHCRRKITRSLQRESPRRRSPGELQFVNQGCHRVVWEMIFHDDFKNSALVLMRARSLLPRDLHELRTMAACIITIPVFPCITLNRYSVLHYRTLLDQIFKEMYRYPLPRYLPNP